MSSKQKNSIGKNVLHLFVSTSLSRILNAFALIILAHYLNSHEYGMFSVALAFAMVAGYFTDAGLSNTVLREGSKQEVNLAAVISSYIKLRVLLLIVTFIGIFITIHAVYDNKELIEMMYGLFIPMIIGLCMQSIGITYFQLTEQMQYLGAIRICSAVFLVIIIGIGMFLSVSPYTIAFLFGLSYLLAGIYGLFLMNKDIKMNMKDSFEKGLLHNIWAFIISGLLIMLLPQLGPLVLENTLTMQQIGLFAVAYRMPSALYQIPGIIAGAFYPVLFKYYSAGNMEEHSKLNIIQLKIMGLLGMVITIPFFHMSDFIIKTLFGETWLYAAGALQILSLLLVLQGISTALADGLTTQGLQTQRTVVQLIAVCIGIVLYYYLSLEGAVEGAAYAAVLIEVCALLGFWMMNPKRGEIAKQGLFLYIVFFAGSLVTVHYFLQHHPVLATIVNILVLACVFADREIREKSMRYMTFIEGKLYKVQ